MIPRLGRCGVMQQQLERDERGDEALEAQEHDDAADERYAAADESNRKHDVLDRLADELDRRDLRALLEEQRRKRNN